MNRVLDQRVKQELEPKEGRATSNSSTNSQHSLPGLLPSQPSAHHPKKKQGGKYKTELCKNFAEKGYCPYRWKCQFAHGQDELHSDSQPCSNGKFRTKKCRTFWEDGFCPYGVRCQFDHHEESTQTTTFYLNIWKVVLSSPSELPKSKLIPIRPASQES